MQYPMLTPLYISFFALPPTVAWTSGRMVSPKAKAMMPATITQIRPLERRPGSTRERHDKAMPSPGHTEAPAGVTLLYVALMLPFAYLWVGLAWRSRMCLELHGLSFRPMVRAEAHKECTH